MNFLYLPEDTHRIILLLLSDGTMEKVNKYFYGLVSNTVNSNTWVNIGKDIGRYINITSLNLCGNKVITGKSLSVLTNITSLNLCGNKVITDKSLSVLTNITSLNLEGNKVITDESLSVLTNII